KRAANNWKPRSSTGRVFRTPSRSFCGPPSSGFVLTIVILSGCDQHPAKNLLLRSRCFSATDFFADGGVNDLAQPFISQRQTGNATRLRIALPRRTANR